MTKSKFIQIGTLQPVNGGYIIDKAFVYYSAILDTRIIAPHGEFTDLASVPKFIPRWIVPVATGRNRKAAVIHDILCRPRYQKTYGITQRQADEVFREALEVCGVGFVGKWGLWAPVRTFQWIKGLFAQ